MPSLERLLKPASLAVFGGREAQRVVEQCRKLGFNGEIWPIHPSREMLGGLPTFASLDDLPGVPDAAYIAVNRRATIDIVRQLSVMGCGGAVCYASGFAEADGDEAGSADLQAQLIAAAGHMPLIGPNCYGFVNLLDRLALWPDQHGARPCDSGVAILTQSSNIAISLSMQQRGLPIAMVMTVGNQATVGMSDLGLALIEDERVTAIGLHIEGFDDLRRFEQLAHRARVLNKPIIAMKTGRSQKARAAAITHTASLAGSDAANAALLRHLGIARVTSLDELLETLKLLHCGGPLTGNRALSLSSSGGEASIIADMAEGTGVQFPDFDDAAKKTLRAHLGPLVGLANPLDYHTYIWGDWPAMEAMYGAAMGLGHDITCLILDPPREDRCDADDWHHALTAWRIAAQTSGARCALVATMAENLTEELAAQLLAEGVTPLAGLDPALKAIEAAAYIGESWNTDPPAPPTLGTAAGESRKIITLDEAASKAELVAFGLRSPRGTVISEGSQIAPFVTASESGKRFVLKGLGIAHKSEAGAVALNLSTVADIEAALAEMPPCETYLLEEMALNVVAELIVGISGDPVIGQIMTIGSGGVLAEILDDTATLLLPAGEPAIRAALGTLKVHHLLDGYRGAPAADIDALVAAIVCISNYALATGDELVELDVNPLMALEFGCLAADALIVKGNGT